MLADRPLRGAELPLAGWVLALTLAVLTPVLRTGYVLTHDMVFTPRQSLGPDSLGVGSALPRAVPVDAITAALETMVTGQVVEKVALVAVLLAAGLGAGLLVPSRSTLLRCAAATLYLWNPYVAERLFIGHWSLLVAYAALPWLVREILRLRAGNTRSWAPVVLLLAVAAITPGGGLIAAVTALPVLAWPGTPGRLGDVVRLAGLWVLVNSPWWLPGMLHGTASTGTSAGVDAFASRAELSLGTVGSLVGLGGIWNAEVVPSSRGTAVALLATLLWPLLSGAGWRPLRTAWGGGAAGLAGSAVLGLLLAAAGSLPGASAVLRWVVMSVPGGGLLRDGQRLVAPLALFFAVAAPLGAERLVARWSEPAVRQVFLLGLIVLPVLVLPDLAWGGLGRLRPVSYPGDWAAVGQILRSDPRPGDVASLPWQPFRQFGWNSNRTVYDPAPRMFSRAVVIDSTLTVGSLVVPPDDARSSAVGDAVRSGSPGELRRLGVGWLLVEKDTPGTVDPDLLRQGALVFDGPALALYWIGPAQGAGWAPWTGLVLAADGLVLLTVLAAAAALVWFRAVRPPRDPAAASMHGDAARSWQSK